MPSRLPVNPKGPLEQAMVLSGAVNNNTSENPANQAMRKALLGITPGATIQNMLGQGKAKASVGVRLPQPQQSTFGTRGQGFGGWSFGADPSANGIMGNPLGIPNTFSQPQSFQNAAGAGMAGQAKLNPNYDPNIQNGFSPKYLNDPGFMTVVDQLTGVPSVIPTVTETSFGEDSPYTWVDLTEPITVPSSVEGGAEFKISQVPFYDPTINNVDEMIKSFLDTGVVPGDWAGTNMTEEQWSALESQAPGGYHYTPWGWVSDAYISSLSGTTSDGGYDYGGYSWGGGGGGTRKAMDQFYFGLMNWGI